jgi:multiple sugar transport system substrate-binding protein
MYYNKDLFAAAGVEEPGTEPLSREAFEEMLTALDESGVQPIAIGTGFQGATLFQTLIQQFGGALTNEEGTEAQFNSEAGAQALEYIGNLKQQYSPDISGEGDPEVNVFQQGNAAIVIHGPWHISNLQQLPFTGFAPFPQIGDQYAVWAGSHQLGLTTDDPAQQAAAACWINWLSMNSVEWAKAGQVPARNSVRESAELGEVAAPIAAVAPAAAEAIILPQVPELEGALWGQFGPVVDGVLLGQTPTSDIQSALDQAAGSSQQIIDENAERYG